MLPSGVNYGVCMNNTWRNGGAGDAWETGIGGWRRFGIKPQYQISAASAEPDARPSLIAGAAGR